MKKSNISSFSKSMTVLKYLLLVIAGGIALVLGLFVFIFILWLISGSTLNTRYMNQINEASRKDNWRTYENDCLGLSLEYPFGDEWSIKESGNDCKNESELYWIGVTHSHNTGTNGVYISINTTDREKKYVPSTYDEIYDRNSNWVEINGEQYIQNGEGDKSNYSYLWNERIVRIRNNNHFETHSEELEEEMDKIIVRIISTIEWEDE